MTTSTLRPNATNVDDADWVRTGGTTKHGVVADDSDSTYIAATSIGPSNPAHIWLGLSTFTLVAGNRFRSARVRVRAGTATPSTSEAFSITLLSGGGTVFGVANNVGVAESAATVTAFTIPLNDQPQAVVDGLQVKLSATNVTTTLRVYEIYVDIVHAVPPTVAITSPTGSPTITTTNRPTAEWIHTPGSDGGPQTFSETKVFTDAQYGAGGFDPDTSTSYWESGIVVGSASFQQTDPLATGDTYRFYVRTAQTINGVAHWSDWDFETFTIAVDTADVEDVTATADNTNARILVAVDRVAASEAWEYIEVQRSTDAGTTWSYVRGGEYVVPAVTSLWSTGDANNFDIYDYETATAETALYRARATRIVSDLPFTGEWVESTPAVAWSSTLAWLKAPNDPTLNLTVKLSTVPQLGYDTPQGVFQALGSTNTIVVSDVMSGVVGSTLTIQTADANEMNDLLALLRATRLLFQPPASWQYGSRYISVGPVTQRPIDTRWVGNTYRRFDVSYNEIDAPADLTAGSP